MAHDTLRHQALDDLMDPPNGWWRTGVEILQGLQLLFERKSSGGILGYRFDGHWRNVLKSQSYQVTMVVSLFISYYGCFIVY